MLEDRETRRYGLVLLAILALVMAMVAMPSTAPGGAGVLLLKAVLLVLVVATAGKEHARGLTVLVAIAGFVAAGASLSGRLPDWIGPALGAAFVIAVIGTMLRGAAALVRDSGVTLQVLFAALGIYLLVGLAFADVIGAVAELDDAPYFIQGTDGDGGERVYFSFVSLTTTGYGDLAPGTGVGRSLAMLEVVTGQVYLVTVVALIVSRLNPRQRSA